MAEIPNPDTHGADRRYATPTGEPCPRAVRCDGGVNGSGECLACGTCLLLAEAAWPDRPGVDGDARS